MNAISKTKARFNCLTYTVGAVADMVGLSRIGGYDWVKGMIGKEDAPFIVFRLNRRILISKPSFDAWLESELGINVPPAFSEDIRAEG